jgi:molecular chaperone Hsp33
MLKRFSPQDLTDMTVNGEVCVTCEFCNSRYCFDPAELVPVAE